MPVLHRTCARARRLTLRVAACGRVSCTRPPRTSLPEAEAFVRAHGPWLAAKLEALPPRVAVVPGARLPVEGRAVALALGDGAARLEGGRLLVPQADPRPGMRAAAWLRGLARERLEAACARHARALGRAHGPIRLRDPRGRWGSCTAAGGLMFSWRLAMAPPEILRYVAAHEVAHLARMDHSPAFWGVVEGLDPGWRACRDWLRREGPGLLRYGFGQDEGRG